MNLEIGSNVGDYQVVGILGAGGMGKVYKVRNVISDRVEAMKVLLPDLVTEPELADRFLREIKVQASLEHPNIASLHTAVRMENQLLMLMEFVEGMTLEQRLKQGPIPVPQALDYIGQVLSALDYAHQRGVIHRDIKPANMMLTPAGIVKLMDFGIAKAASDKRLTMTGTTMGSLYYMSPEQIQGASNLDARSDLYSVGVSLYELLTGKRPFDGDSQFAIMSAHLQGTPVPPVQIDPRLPQALNDAILQSVSKDPSARFQTAGAFRNVLRQLSGQPAAAAHSPMGPQIIQPTQPSRPHSNRWLWMTAGGVATAAVLVGVIQLAPWKGTKAAPQVAAPVTQQVSAPPPVVEQPAATPVQPDPQPQSTTEPPASTPGRPAVVSKPQREPSHAAAQQQPVQTPAQTPVQQPPAVPAQAVQPPPQPTVSPSNQAELQNMREELAAINASADAQRTKWGAIQRDLQAKGGNLNTDRQEQLSLTNTFLDGAAAALRDNNTAKARDLMDKAEYQIKKLSK